MTIRPDQFANQLLYRESTTGETLQLLAPVSFLEEFLAQSFASPWGTRDTGAATETLPVSADNGYAQLALDATNEVQLAGLDFANHRPFVLNRKLMFEAKVRFSTLPTGAVVACIGLCGNHNAAVNTVAESIWFRLDGSGVITVETDDTVHETSQVASGVTVIANQDVILRIEIDDVNSVRFYINGVRKASATTFNMSQVAALALQPVLRIGKEGAAVTVGTMQVDYVRIWQKRS